MTPARALVAILSLSLFALTPDLSAGGGGIPEIKVPLGGKPVKYKLDLGFKLTCPHKLDAEAADGGITQIDYTSGFTKNPTFTFTGLQLGTTLVSFDVIAKDTFEMSAGPCQGSASSQAFVTVVPDLSSAEKDDKKSYKSIAKDYRMELAGIRKDAKQENKSLLKSFKKEEVTYDELVDIFFSQAADGMEQAYQLGMTALSQGAAVGSATLQSVGQDGYHTDGYMQGGGGTYDDFFLDVTEDWWKTAQSFGPELRKAMDKLNKTSDLAEDEQVEFNFVGTWATFSQEAGPVGAFDEALTSATRRPLKILCAATRALKCDPSSGRLSVGGWAEPGEQIEIDYSGPDGFDGGDTTTADDDGAFGITFQLSFVDAAPGALPSGMYRVDVSYGESDLGDVIYIQVP